MMAFDRLNYGKSWNSPEDFPTYEDSEAQVRADLQYHPDAVRDYLNGVLLPALEGAGGAGRVGASDGGTVQELLDRCVADIQTLAGGGVPSVSQCVRVEFAEEDWTEDEEAGSWSLTIPQSSHRRTAAGYGLQLWQTVDGAALSGTWGTASTAASGRNEDGEIVLTAPAPYDGAAVFFGV